MPLLKPPRGTQLNKTHPLARGLVGCWLFNEVTGNKVFDLSSNNRTGTFVGNTKWNVQPFGSVLDFDGAGDKVSFTTVAQEKITICVQLYSRTKGNSDYPRILDMPGYTCYFDRPVGNNFIHFRSLRATTAGAWRSPIGSVTDSIWYHIAITYDGSSTANDPKIYINGVSQTVGELSVPAGTQTSNAGTGYMGDRAAGDRSWDGYFVYLMIFNRVLSTAEIARLYREPFCMFDLSIAPGLLYPAGQVIWLTAASTATSSVYGSLTKQSKLAGIIDAAAALSAILTWRYRGQVERQWLIEALFDGMTANAFKLGTVLTGGWFWMRRFGCCTLYRGPSMEQVYFANILTVAEQDAGSISPPSYIPHHSNSTYFYVVRRFNICGYQERTLAAAVKVAIDTDGNLIKPKPNNIFAWRLDQVYGNKIQLIWFYCPLEQESKPESFRIYYDGGTGLVDYENPIATINYQGRKFYTYQSDALTAGRYLFAVRAEDAAGVENNSLAQLPIQLATGSPDSIEILSVQNV